MKTTPCAQDFSWPSATDGANFLSGCQPLSSSLFCSFTSASFFFGCSTIGWLSSFSLDSRVSSFITLLASDDAAADACCSELEERRSDIFLCMGHGEGFFAYVIHLIFEAEAVVAVAVAEFVSGLYLSPSLVRRARGEGM